MKPWLLLPLLALPLVTVPAQALQVRVDAVAGAPRLTVNGAPVRARMFWGGPARKPIPCTTEWKLINEEFTALQSEPATATMHLRCAQVPGDIVFDDIQVTDLTTGKDVIPLCDFEGGPEAFTRDWTYWPTDEQNTVGEAQVQPGVGHNGSAGLHVTLHKPVRVSWPDYHVYHRANLSIVKGHRYQVRFWMRGSENQYAIISFYRPGTPFVFLGAPGDCFPSQIKLAGAVGVNFVSFPVNMPWPKPGDAVDWTDTDNQIDTVLMANPKALLLPRLSMGAPEWWLQAHPDAAMRWEDGTHGSKVATVSSLEYRQDVCTRLAALITHLEEKYGDHIAGYHPCGQNTGEWFYQDTWGRQLNGYAPTDTAAWRQWLSKRYPSDAALQTAWNDTKVTRETAAVPSPEARHAAPAGVLRDPLTEQALIDFAAFQQDTMADCVCELARVVRRESRGQKLVVFFYGYGFEFSTVYNGPATSGHYAFRRLLDCPDVDVLCSPISYFDRGPGGSAPAMSAAESVALAGKLWLYEDDTATYLSTGTPPGWQERVKTLAETNAELSRNVAEEALRNFGTWWMDLTTTGWFDDPGMWAEMKRLEALDLPLLQKPTPFRPQVAAVLDEASMLRVASGGRVVTHPGVYEARASLARMGAPYGQYLLDDVQAGRVHAKLYAFLNAWCLTATQRAQLLKATRGSVRLWCYAPGYYDGDRASLPAMQALTGFKLAPVDLENALATPTAVGKRLGLTEPFGAKEKVRPLFAATDARPAEVLATYSDGSAAVALRRTGSGYSLFVGAPGFTPALLRAAARTAGVHLFTSSDCNTYANGHFLALHASQDGPLAVNTGKPGPVRDLYTGKVVGQGPRFTLTLKRAETRILRY